MAVRRVCFVSCLRWPDVSESDGFVKRALEGRGVRVEVRAWNDPAATFEGFDAVVLRSNWDYHFAPDAFLEWLGRWERMGVRFWNPPALVRWNLSKRYLLDLAAAGVPVVPTMVVDGQAAGLPALLAERGWATAVVKPVVSASAYDTVLVPLAEAPAVAAAMARGEIRVPVLVQPFLEEIRTRGEWSLVFIDGAFTHGVLKHPAPHDFRVQPRLGGRAAAATPPAAVLEAAEQVVAALPGAPLYARIDGVERAGHFTVMEVELNEPGLFFTFAPRAAERFADAIEQRLR
jgi:glutathione synthase/RimK-type ligase-like ATP-grasp enzyme